MKRILIVMLAALMLGPIPAAAAVQKLELKIAGFLCGFWVYNIAKAVSRLDFAPKRSEIKITDVTQGLGEFVPKPARPVSFAALAATLKKAGYTLDRASISAEGIARQEAGTWYLQVLESKQRFELRGFSGLEPGATVTVRGRWLPADSAGGAEIIAPHPPRS